MGLGSIGSGGVSPTGNRRQNSKTKTIDDYKKDYAAAKVAGDARGMQDANDAANQIRNARGEAAQLATQDIANVARKSSQRNSEGNTYTSSSVSSSALRNEIEQKYNAYKRQLLDDMDREKRGIKPYYEDVRNQAAATQAQNQQAFNEYAAARGLNSGAGGQAYLAQQNAYGNALNAADVAEANAYADISEQQKQLAAQTDFQKAQALYGEMARQQSVQQAKDQFDAQLAIQQQAAAQAQQNYEQEWQQRVANDEYKRLVNSANSLASIGDYSGYKSLYGWTDNQIGAAEALYQAQMAGPARGSGTSKKRSSGTSYTKSATSTTSSSGAGSASTPVSASDFVSNTSGVNSAGVLDWVSVRGYGRLSAPELAALINQGKIVETYDSATGKYKYSPAR